MNKTRILTLCFVLIATPGLAAAATFFCDGQVGSVGLNNGPGRLYVSYGTVQMQNICMVDAPYNGVEAATCKAWLAVLTAAQAQQRTIRFYYDTANGNPPSCDSFPAWGQGTPYFLQTVD